MSAPPGFYADADGNNIECAEPSMDRCVGGNECGEMYSVPPACLECSPGYYPYGLMQECTECPDFMIFYVVGLIVVCFGVCIVLMRFARSGTHFMTSLSVGFNFLQVLAVLATFNIGWEPLVLTFLEYLAVFNLDLGWFSVDCLAKNNKMTFKEKWVLKLIFPFSFFVIFGILYGVLFAITHCRLMSRSRKAKKARKAAEEAEEEFNEYNERVTVTSVVDHRVENIRVSKKRLGWITIDAMLALSLLLYISLVATSLEVFECAVPEDSDSGRAFFRNTTVVCYDNASEGLTLQIVAGVAVGLYGLGIPSVVFLVLWINQNDLHIETNVLKYGLLYRRYVLSCFLFELAIVGRKICILLTKVFPGLQDTERVVVVLVVLIVALAFHLWLKPYQASRINRLEALNLLALLIIALTGLLFFSPLLGELRKFFSPLIGTWIVVMSICLTLLHILLVILYDIRHARRMKSHGLVGGFANDDVQVFPHFFNTEFRIASENKFVTTTNHYSDIVIAYPNFMRSRLTMEVKVRVGTKYLQKEMKKRRKENRTVCHVGLQHDRQGAYHVNGIFPVPGNYEIMFSGGKPVYVGESFCGPKTNKLDTWHPKRHLMRYRLVVTRGCGENQQLVSTKEASRYNAIVLSPVYRYLSLGKVYFRIKMVAAEAIKVTAEGQEYRLSPQSKGIFAGEFSVTDIGPIYVYADIPVTLLRGGATLKQVEKRQSVNKKRNSRLVDADNVEVEERLILTYESVPTTLLQNGQVIYEVGELDQSQGGGDGGDGGDDDVAATADEDLVVDSPALAEEFEPDNEPLPPYMAPITEEEDEPRDSTRSVTPTAIASIRPQAQLLPALDEESEGDDEMTPLKPIQPNGADAAAGTGLGTNVSSDHGHVEELPGYHDDEVDSSSSREDERLLDRPDPTGKRSSRGSAGGGTTGVGTGSAGGTAGGGDDDVADVLGLPPPVDMAPIVGAPAPASASQPPPPPPAAAAASTTTTASPPPPPPPAAAAEAKTSPRPPSPSPSPPPTPPPPYASHTGVNAGGATVAGLPTSEDAAARPPSPSPPAPAPAPPAPPPTTAVPPPPAAATAPATTTPAPASSATAPPPPPPSSSPMPPPASAPQKDTLGLMASGGGSGEVGGGGGGTASVSDLSDLGLPEEFELPADMVKHASMSDAPPPPPPPSSSAAAAASGGEVSSWSSTGPGDLDLPPPAELPPPPAVAAAPPAAAPSPAKPVFDGDGAPLPSVFARDDGTYSD